MKQFDILLIFEDINELKGHNELKLLANIDWLYLLLHCSKLKLILLLSIFICNKYESYTSVTTISFT